MLFQRVISGTEPKGHSIICSSLKGQCFTSREHAINKDESFGSVSFLLQNTYGVEPKALIINSLIILMHPGSFQKHCNHVEAKKK